MYITNKKNQTQLNQTQALKSNYASTKRIGVTHFFFVLASKKTGLIYFNFFFTPNSFNKLDLEYENIIIFKFG